MNITQDEGTLSMISQEASGYGFIHVIQNVRVDSETFIASDEFTTSTSYYTLTEDGYFIITEIKLPITAGSGYYMDIGEEIIYDPNDNVISTEALLATDTELTNIVRVDEDWISMFILQDYYIKLLKAKYLKNICNCGCGCMDKTDKVRLDTLTMGLDLIEALQAKNQYYEIQRIVEKLMVCFGLIDANCNCS